MSEPRDLVPDISSFPQLDTYTNDVRLYKLATSASKVLFSFLNSTFIFLTTSSERESLRGSIFGIDSFRQISSIPSSLNCEGICEEKRQKTMCLSDDSPEIFNSSSIVFVFAARYFVPVARAAERWFGVVEPPGGKRRITEAARIQVL